MKRTLLLAFASLAMIVGSANAQVVVRIGPPRAIVETRGVAPGAGYVWTPGYHRYVNNAYVWTPGAWVQPPRPHAVWVAHRWARRNGGWYLAEGHWR
jgi:hypothetical protein